MKDFLDTASKAYYEGNPIISDAEFDILASHFDYKDVGYKVTGGIPHYYSMYSLDKCYDLDNAPLDLNACVETPKLDGAAISILFVGGELSLALTRGDGKLGQDVTENVKCLVPNTMKRKGIIQLTGEVIAPSSIENARNYAAGALNLKNIDKFKTRDLTFVLYDVQPNPFDTWTEIMEVYESMGYNTVLHFDISKYPTDGTVYRLNGVAEYEAMGFTAKHPRGAFAHKVQAAGIRTKLLDVVWQLGKSGVVSPVAILEPINIGGAIVSKATLHNIKYIQDLGLEIGCDVEVIRSGDIIPRVVRRVG